MKWQSLLMPRGFSVENPDEVPNYAKIIVEPLERGWGHTLGNALRRALLSSLQGAAVTAVKIDGAAHEYANIAGISEDISDIILNIKKLRVKLISDEKTVLKVVLKGKGVITAGDIESNPDVEILNPELVIATINEDANSSIEMIVEDGKGYVSAEQNKQEGLEEGYISIDSIFSPVVRVNYHVENARVGKRAELDKLILEITTDGSLTPEESVSYAAKIFYDQLDQLINVKAQFESLEEEVVDEKTEKFRSLLMMRIDDLELSVRSNNCLRAANIQTLADLVRNQETDMLKYKNFGRKSLIELSQVLASNGLTFGMDVDKIMGNND